MAPCMYDVQKQTAITVISEETVGYHSHCGAVNFVEQQSLLIF